jgi:NADH-quinone oxidoreductase subunit M
MLRMFIRSMHNRVGPGAESRELRFADGLVLVPLVAAIIALSLYPQVALEKGERSTVQAVQAAKAAAAGESTTVEEVAGP